jgi:DNA-directed RNA polymerase subunit alpha
MSQNTFSVLSEKNTATYGKFIIEPLPQGFGHTLGNSLRRVLYSSIPGAAITSVTINGASHQFTSIEGVKEDVVQIILNLKLVRLAYSGDKPVKITLSAKGPGVITAGQFELPANVKIANPDSVIATLNDKSTKFELEATVEAGLGYSPAEDRKSSTLGSIPVDAVFTPISRVNYSVEATRVGRVTNFDKLILEVFTDGTISPEQSLKAASSTLVDYFSSIVNPQAAGSDSSNPSSSSNPGSNISIEELDLPTRISNALLKAGFESVGDLFSTPRAELAKVKNLGSKSVKIIELALRERGFELPQ